LVWVSVTVLWFVTVSVAVSVFVLVAVVVDVFVVVLDFGCMQAVVTTRQRLSPTKAANLSFKDIVPPKRVIVQTPIFLEKP
jgi:hypothetical protein